MDISLEQLDAAVPFSSHIGIRFISASAGEVSAKLELSDEVGNFAGMMHGGAIMTLADTAGSTCAFLNLPPNTVTTTTDSNTRFLRPISSGDAVATARPLRVGRTSIVVEVEIHDQQGRLAAKTSMAQAVISTA